jgi:DNA-binding transcriptional ArsR family regulator
MPRPASASDPFLAVADPTRRAILDRLRRGEAPFAELVAAFDMSAPAVSRHLRVLREAQLVQETRDGRDARQRIYRLDPAPLRDVVEWARGYEQFWNGNLTSLKRYVERRKRRNV